MTDEADTLPKVRRAYGRFPQAVRRAYQRAEYRNERKQMMQWWADKVREVTRYYRARNIATRLAIQYQGQSSARQLQLGEN